MPEMRYWLPVGKRLKSASRAPLGSSQFDELASYFNNLRYDRKMHQPENKISLSRCVVLTRKKEKGKAALICQVGQVVEAEAALPTSGCSTKPHSVQISIREANLAETSESFQVADLSRIIGQQQHICIIMV